VSSCIPIGFGTAGQSLRTERPLASTRRTRMAAARILFQSLLGSCFDVAFDVDSMLFKRYEEYEKDKDMRMVSAICEQLVCVRTQLCQGHGLQVKSGSAKWTAAVSSFHFTTLHPSAHLCFLRSSPPQIRQKSLSPFLLSLTLSRTLHVDRLFPATLLYNSTLHTTHSLTYTQHHIAHFWCTYNNLYRSAVASVGFLTC